MNSNSICKKYLILALEQENYYLTLNLLIFLNFKIEPYGVDYILQRLGFNHARTTIPKWLQRGCMDPLDKILSVIVLKTIQVVQEEKASLKN
jgi:hypothetical protein